MKSILYLLFPLTPYLAQAQQPIITGVAYNENKTQLTGANVYIKGSYDGTTTYSFGYLKASYTKLPVKSIVQGTRIIQLFISLK